MQGIEAVEILNEVVANAGISAANGNYRNAEHWLETAELHNKTLKIYPPEFLEAIRLEAYSTAAFDQFQEALNHIKEYKRIVERTPSYGDPCHSIWAWNALEQAKQLIEKAGVDAQIKFIQMESENLRDLQEFAVKL